MSRHTAPRHPFDVHIHISGEDWDYVIRTLDELARHIPEHGKDCNMAVTIFTRDVSKEQFRKELHEWWEAERAERRTLADKEKP